VNGLKKSNDFHQMNFPQTHYHTNLYEQKTNPFHIIGKTTTSPPPSSSLPPPPSLNNLSHAKFNYLKNFVLLPAIIIIFGFQQIASANINALSEGISQSASQSGFIQSFLLIFISEIGDKTFFIAGLLAAKYGKLISFVGSMSALAVMTIISTILGQTFHAVPPSLSKGVPFDDIIAVIAFTYFGLKTLYDASKLAIDDNTGIEEEKEEAEKSIAEISKRNSLLVLLAQIFSLVFAAEIGDRSFISTIALSAAQNPFSVAVGAIAAHASATAVAVFGGELLSKYLSEKIIGYIGGTLFLIFAATTARGLL
jgi:putative Ca2+/H+ antiporter (TMEM165/GDT1 family)